MARVLARLVLLAAILVPAAAGAVDFDCRERAYELSTVDPTTCVTSTDLATCAISCTRPAAATVPAQCFSLPVVCTTAGDPSTCTATGAFTPLLEVPGAVRTAALANQPLLRRVTVHSGPHTDVILAKVALNELADGVFRAGRDQLCVPPPPPPVVPDPDPGSTPVGGGSGALGGGSPGLVGGNPGLRGGNPGLIGPDPGISIRR